MMGGTEEGRAIAREVERLHLSRRDRFVVLCGGPLGPIQGIGEVFWPARAAIRRRVARNLPTEDELIARWLDEEPGARLLASRHGRASLIVRARLCIMKALDGGEQARTSGSSWTAVERIADRMVRAID